MLSGGSLKVAKPLDLLGNLFQVRMSTEQTKAAGPQVEIRYRVGVV